MDRALTKVLQCPVCTAPMDVDATGTGAIGLVCQQGHRFDGARQGYFNLLTGKASGFIPDTAAMVQARTSFLDAGHYDRLAEAVAGCTSNAAGTKTQPVIADAGAGTGFYLGAALESINTARAVAMDISKYALRRAARVLPEALCLVWDIWRPLPFASGSIDVMLNIFAPRNPSEFARVLVPDGRLIVVTPLPGHLKEIRHTASLLAVQAEKSDHLARTLEPYFVREEYDDVEFSMALEPADIRLAALMGPSAHHIDEEALQANLRSFAARTDVTAAFRISVYTKR